MEAVRFFKTQENLCHCYRAAKLGRKNPNRWKVLMKGNCTAKTQP